MSLKRESFTRIAIIVKCIRLVRIGGAYTPHYGEKLNYRHRNYIATLSSKEVPQKWLLFN